MKKSNHLLFLLSALSLGSVSLHAATLTDTTYEVDGHYNGGTVDFVNGVAPTGTAPTLAAESSNSYGSNLALATGGATYTSDFTTAYGNSAAVLINGDLGADTFNFADSTFNGSSATVNFTLTLPSNATGYNIGNIAVVSGDAAVFADQNYSLSYSTDGTHFTSLGSYSLTPASGAGALTLETSLTATSGGLIASGVKALTFTFTAPSENQDGWNTGYREVEVFGAATPGEVPEPSTYALVVGGLAMLAALRLRRLSNGSV